MLCEPLMHIANKLLGRQHLNFDQLTPPEQELWSLFENSEIYEFLTGQIDTVPELFNFCCKPFSDNQYTQNCAKFAAYTQSGPYSKNCLCPIYSGTLFKGKESKS
jgi:hypothetical protein